ncbi:MAG: nicotinate (nicotinamide) nucleotide adenylyltransferase [Thermoanaerobaculia bacterium]
MKIGVFGGSFDPFHYGHLWPVREARRRLGLDRVIYLPTADPPHKPGGQSAPAWSRFAMVELALLREEGMQVSALELTPGRPAYTVDSLACLAGQHPGDELWLIIGGDNFTQLPSWKSWRRIPELARLAVLMRTGQRARVEESWPTELRRLATGDRVEFVGNRQVRISSTRLRELLAAGGDPPPRTLPRVVLQYIRKYSLYR